MKIKIHDTIVRPWGFETAYTAIDDEGFIYNGFLPYEKITENQIIDVITKRKEQIAEETAVTVDKFTIEKNELLCKIDLINEKIEELEKATIGKIGETK